MTSAEIDGLARIVWDYHQMGHALGAADIILVQGSHDLIQHDLVRRQKLAQESKRLCPDIVQISRLGEQLVSRRAKFHGHSPRQRIFAE